MGKNATDEWYLNYFSIKYIFRDTIDLIQKEQKELILDQIEEKVYHSLFDYENNFDFNMVLEKNNVHEIQKEIEKKNLHKKFSLIIAFYCKKFVFESLIQL